MFGLGAGEIFIILAFALIFIGPKKLPELARNLGKGLREFQKAKDDLMNHVNSDDDEDESDHHASLTDSDDSDKLSDELEEEVSAMKEALQKKSEEKSS